MWKAFILFFLAETNALRLRGMYNQKREKVIEGQASEYFFEIYKNTVLTASTTNKYTNYSFYEYGCIPLRSGMVDLKYMGYKNTICDVHRENINYYTNIFLKNREDVFETKYGIDISDSINNVEECIQYQIDPAEINKKIIKKLHETFTDINITNITNNCCTEYTITW
jgi:hypothetical protein